MSLSSDDFTRIRREALGTIKMLFWGGLVVALIGAVLVITAWPGYEMDGPTIDYDGTGSRRLVSIGWVLVGLGYLGAAVGAVGFGVKLGREASAGRP